MIADALYPRTKGSLITVLQKMNIQEVAVHEPYHVSDERALIKLAKEMSARPGNVTVILVRTP
jgi:hypothetical protein